MFKELFTEAVKITEKKTDKMIAGIEGIVGSGYEIEVEFYGGFGVDPMFSVEPKPDNTQEVTGYLEKNFKKNRVITRELNDYVTFSIK